MTPIEKLADDVLTIAEYVDMDIERFNRFINAAKMCGYELVRNGKPLRNDPQAAAACPECDGSAVVTVSYPVPECCGNPTPDGECCGNAVEGQEISQEQCAACHATGRALRPATQTQDGWMPIEFRTGQASGWNKWQTVEIPTEIAKQDERSIKEYLQDYHVGSEQIHDHYRGLEFRFLPAPTGWFPIETAPKDGTEVDLYEPWKGHPISGLRWTSCSYRNKDRDEPECYGRGKKWRQGCGSPINNPSHWRPIPAPPAAPQCRTCQDTGFVGKPGADTGCPYCKSKGDENG